MYIPFILILVVIHIVFYKVRPGRVEWNSLRGWNFRAQLVTSALAWTPLIILSIIAVGGSPLEAAIVFGFLIGCILKSLLLGIVILIRNSRYFAEKRNYNTPAEQSHEVTPEGRDTV